MTRRELYRLQAYRLETLGISSSRSLKLSVTLEQESDVILASANAVDAHTEARIHDKGRPRRRVTLPEWDEPGQIPNDYDEALDRTLLKALVQRAALTDTESAVLELRLIHGLTYTQIGEMSARSKQACQQMVARAIVKIRAAVDVSELFEPNE